MAETSSTPAPARVSRETSEASQASIAEQLAELKRMINDLTTLVLRQQHTGSQGARLRRPSQANIWPGVGRR